jgi:predicted DsbA family dithiol-disulfide isomerase
MPLKKLKLPNPWILTSIALILIFAGLICYDKSPTFRGNINYLLGLKEEQIPEGEPKQVNLIVLNDKFFANPPYDLDEKVTQVKNELESELIIKNVDINDEEGKKLIADYNLKSVPVLIFDENFGKTGFYKDASPYFSAENNNYLLRLQPFKFLQLPQAGDAWAKGNNNAKITIIEYSSFTCPYCTQMGPVFDQALKEYPDKIKFVYKNFNRGGLDPLVENAAECAGEQNKFWEMHDYIFENQKALVSGETEQMLKDQAKTLGLDSAKFDECIASEKYLVKIDAQTNEAFTFSVSGTPGIFVNDVFIGGAVDYETLKQVIDSFNP